MGAGDGLVLLGRKPRRGLTMGIEQREDGGKEGNLSVVVLSSGNENVFRVTHG